MAGVCVLASWLAFGQPPPWLLMKCVCVGWIKLETLSTPRGYLSCLGLCVGGSGIVGGVRRLGCCVAERERRGRVWVAVREQGGVWVAVSMKEKCPCLEGEEKGARGKS